MSVSTAVTAVISAAALILSIANFIRARRERGRANRIEAEALIDEAYALVTPVQGGHFSASDLAPRQDARALVNRAEKVDASSPSVILWRAYIKEADGDMAGARKGFEKLPEEG